MFSQKLADFMQPAVERHRLLKDVLDSLLKCYTKLTKRWWYIMILHHILHSLLKSGAKFQIELIRIKVINFWIFEFSSQVRDLMTLQRIVKEKPIKWYIFYVQADYQQIKIPQQDFKRFTTQLKTNICKRTVRLLLIIRLISIINNNKN